MKKIISLFVCIYLIIVSVPVFADTTETEVPQKTGEAIALIEAVTGIDFFDSDCTAPVTRADFMYLIGKTMNAAGNTEQEKVFSDVADNAQYTPYVYWALERGFISEAELFRPDDVISPDEAIKICVSAMGQAKFAEMDGGYPDGYRKIATDADLFRYMHNAEVMTKNNVAIMIYNMLLSELLSVESILGNNISYSYVGKTLLYEIHKIEIIEGIITQTNLTSFDKEYSYNKNTNYISVNGNSYECDIDANKYFGMNCLVYCKGDIGEQTVVGLYPRNNKTLQFDLEDVDDFEGNYLVINTENGRQKKYKVKNSYTEVYNGKVTSPDRSHITDLTGTVKLLDNDRDGVYDILYISHYTYAQVRNVNIPDRIIEDKKSAGCNINIDDEYVYFSINDSLGNTVKVSELKQGDILAVLKSEDNTVVEITVLKNPISSKIDSVNDAEGTITVDGTEYIVSDYARSFAQDRFRAGDEIEFYVNINGEIAFASFTGERYTYGYLTKVYADDSGEDFFVKIYASVGAFKTFEMADKLLLDADKKSGSYVRDVLTDKPQFIRYKLNKDDKVISIDTAEECVIDSSVTLEQWEAEKNEDDKLTKYDYGKSSYMFRQNYCFGTSFNAVGATVFLLPAKEGNSNLIDVSNTEDFEMLDITKIQTGFAYSYFDVYDVNEFGTASVIVARNVKTSGSPYSLRAASNLKSQVGMISYMTPAVNDDGDFGFNLEIWSNGTFKEYFMSEDVECITRPNTRLDKGDIVRFRADGDEIKEVILDFAYGAFDSNYSYNNASAQFNKGNTTLTYQVGKLYNYDENFCSYSNVKTAEQYDFAPVNLNNSSVNTDNVCCFDEESGTISTITVNELRSAKLYGDNADYVLIKQDGLITQCIFVYRNGGN